MFQGRLVFSFDSLPSQIPHTPKEVVVAISMEDFSFVQHLSKAEKMELLPKVTHHTCQTTYLFSIIDVGRGNVLEICNPSSERDTWKGKCKDMENKLSIF